MISYLLSITPEEFKPKLTDIYERYRVSMVQYARACLINYGVSNFESDSEDVVQNAFVKIIKYRNRINDLETQTDIKRYVMRIVRNEAINHINELELVKEYDDENIVGVTEEDFYSALLIKEKYEKVTLALKRLSEIYIDTLSFKIAEGLDVPELQKL